MNERPSKVVVAVVSLTVFLPVCSYSIVSFMIVQFMCAHHISTQYFYAYKYYTTCLFFAWVYFHYYIKPLHNIIYSNWLSVSLHLWEDDYVIKPKYVHMRDLEFLWSYSRSQVSQHKREKEEERGRERKRELLTI